jgi:predicted acyltransferase
MSATEAVLTAPAPMPRLASLDVFRGVTIACMMLVNNPGSEHVYTPLEHADWHGWTFTDTVFPFFLWIVGVAMTLSFARRVERGADRGKLLLHALQRSAVIFGVGLLLNGFPYYHLSTLRIPGVLSRIAVCYLIAAAIFLFTKVRGQVIAIVVLLAGYWMLMKLVPVPGVGAGHLGKEANFAHWIDSLVLTGHMWSHTKTWDPEGIVSTLPAIATVLFGILAGHLLRSRRSPAERTSWLFFGGNALICLGLILNVWMPINKNLWTTSFSVFMAGLATVVFAIWYWLIDVQRSGRLRWWTRPFAIYGMNAIAVYILSGLIGRLMSLFHWHAPVFDTLFAPLSANPENASLYYAIAFTLMLYLAAYAMYRRGWFLKF